MREAVAAVLRMLRRQESELRDAAGALRRAGLVGLAASCDRQRYQVGQLARELDVEAPYAARQEKLPGV